MTVTKNKIEKITMEHDCEFTAREKPPLKPVYKKGMTREERKKAKEKASIRQSQWAKIEVFFHEHNGWTASNLRPKDANFLTINDVDNIKFCPYCGEALPSPEEV